MRQIRTSPCPCAPWCRAEPSPLDRSEHSRTFVSSLSLCSPRSLTPPFPLGCLHPPDEQTGAHQGGGVGGTRKIFPLGPISHPDAVTPLLGAASPDSRHEGAAVLTSVAGTSPGASARTAVSSGHALTDTTPQESECPLYDRPSVARNVPATHVAALCRAQPAERCSALASTFGSSDWDPTHTATRRASPTRERRRPRGVNPGAFILLEPDLWVATTVPDGHERTPTDTNGATGW